MDCTFTDKVRATIAKNNMLAPGDTIVVAVSGGADSVALLHALWSIKGALSIDLVAAHLNHQIRGDEADQDAAFVQEFARDLGVQCVVGCVDVPQLQREQKIGLEEAARNARYAFLRQVSARVGGRSIAVAHTSDDHVESVILNIMRGSGTDGLGGISAAADDIVRPLIEVRRAEVEEYLLSLGLTWRDDSTNIDTTYTRNRVRHELIPYIEREFNPRIRHAISSLSMIAREESDFVEKQAGELYRSSLIDVDPDEVRLDASILGNSHPALIRRCVRIAIEIIKGDLKDIAFEQTERIADGICSNQRFDYTLTSGMFRAAMDDGVFRVFRVKEAPDYALYAYELRVPGRTNIPEVSACINAELGRDSGHIGGANAASIDAAKLVGPLMVRNWLPGDRIVPFGMIGHKKLQDLFTDRKIPRDTRRKTPVVVDSEKVVWVVGVSVSNLVKVDADSHKVLRLTYCEDC